MNYRKLAEPQTDYSYLDPAQRPIGTVTRITAPGEPEFTYGLVYRTSEGWIADHACCGISSIHATYAAALARILDDAATFETNENLAEFVAAKQRACWQGPSKTHEDCEEAEFVDGYDAEDFAIAAAKVGFTVVNVYHVDRYHGVVYTAAER